MVGDDKSRVMIVDDLAAPITPEQLEKLRYWFDKVTGFTVIQLPYHEPNAQLELWPELYGFF
jgi:hypothetical protein